MIATVLLAAAFLPTWKSVEAGFSVPPWFDDAKFGVECRWGGADATAANWKPDELCALWKRMGARYFIAAGTLKDGVDNWNSAKGEANSLKTGPRRDLLDGWMKAAGRENLRFGASFHASRMGEKAAPTKEYRGNYRDRILDAASKYKLDILYFDDRVFPFWPMDWQKTGLEILSGFYNDNAARNGGKCQGVATGKRLGPPERKSLVWNIERGTTLEKIEPHWQGETCLGNWMYDGEYFKRGKYRDAKFVLRMLADVVSKNGNLLLSVPLKPVGTMDEKERAVCEDIAAWMKVNGEAIFGTVPWKVCGEGAQFYRIDRIHVEGHNERSLEKPTLDDMRYTASKDGRTVYAIALVPPRDGDRPACYELWREGFVVDRRLAQVKDLPAVYRFRYDARAHDAAKKVLAELTPGGEPRAIGVAVNGSLERGEVERKTSGASVAVRYVLPEAKRRVTGERTLWRLPDEAKVWYQPNMHTYDGKYEWKTVKDIKRWTEMALPVTAKMPDGTYRMITEANLVGWTDMAVRYLGDGIFESFYHADREGFDCEGKVVTPWRVMIAAKDIAELYHSSFVRNLCPPPSSDVAAKAARFAKPGRAAWQWLSTGAPIYAEQREWIDATAKLGFEYYVIDDGWKRWRDAGADEWKCLEGVVAYAAKKKVRCVVWVNANDVADRQRMRDFLSKVKKSGAVGVKIDLIPEANRQWVDWYEMALEETFAAELFVAFHGAVKPTGRERTWPHELAREAVMGHEFHAARWRRTMPAEQDVIHPFNRLVQGPAAYTPVVLEPGGLGWSIWPREVAQGVIFASPFLCFGDRPKNYLNSPMKDLILGLPPVYDETVVLPGSEIGECVALARRKGDTWYVAVESGWRESNLDIPLTFLPEGKWKMTAYTDKLGVSAGCDCAETDVTSKDRIKILVRHGGGYVAILKRSGK